MSDKHKTEWDTFLKVWIPFSFFITAISLIQLADNFWPALIKWVSFFQFWIDSIRLFRDILFYPFEWIHPELIGLFKDYVLVGIFISNCYLFGHKLFLKRKLIPYYEKHGLEYENLEDYVQIIKRKFKEDPLIDFVAWFFVVSIAFLTLWPVLAVGSFIMPMFSPEGFGRDYISLTRNIILKVLLIASIVIFINFIILRLIDSYGNYMN